MLVQGIDVYSSVDIDIGTEILRSNLLQPQASVYITAAMNTRNPSTKCFRVYSIHD